jgi:hypothetical protein
VEAAAEAGVAELLLAAVAARPAAVQVLRSVAADSRAEARQARRSARHRARLAATRARWEGTRAATQEADRTPESTGIDTTGTNSSRDHFLASMVATPTTTRTITTTAIRSDVCTPRKAGAGVALTCANIRIESSSPLADIDVCAAHVRFTLKVDMCGARADVCFGPEADIANRKTALRRSL